MAFTGELEHLHIVDIIQLLSTTRKSGTFSVTGSRGESRIIFSNGYIVGASHLNKVSIGTVLIKMNAITLEDLDQALKLQKSAGKTRKPLVTTLIEMGRLDRDKAFNGLKTLIEMTIVELIGWTKGTFTLDTEAISVSPECSYLISKMEQEITLDAQMILMDTLRIFDERERDRQAGKTVLSDEEIYSDILSSEGAETFGGKEPVITADDLGLGDLERLERKIPQFPPVTEIFDPRQIHRQHIKEMLADFSSQEQETFASFLERASASMDARDGTQRQEGRTRGLIMFSEDELLRHSVITICKEEGVLVFATDGEEELVRIINQCLLIKVLPILVFDNPKTPDSMLLDEKIISLRQKIKERYPQVSTIQMACQLDYSNMLQSFHDGIRAVFPKPSKKARHTTFIEDTIKFLETFKSYIKGFFLEQKDPDELDNQMGKLRDRMLEIRSLAEPSAVSLALLQQVSEICERSITFIVGQAELTGEKAIGVYAERNAGPTSVTRMKIPLSKPSLLSDVVEKGEFFYGEIDDEILKKYLFEVIGEPMSPAVLLLPMKSSDNKVVTLTYGDFGEKEAMPVQSQMLEILANEAGLVLENALYRRQGTKGSQK
jgi:hypothetical protein